MTCAIFSGRWESNLVVAHETADKIEAGNTDQLPAERYPEDAAAILHSLAEQPTLYQDRGRFLVSVLLMFFPPDQVFTLPGIGSALLDNWVSYFLRRLPRSHAERRRLAATLPDIADPALARQVLLMIANIFVIPEKMRPPLSATICYARS